MSANNIDIFFSKQTSETRKKQNNVTKRSYFHIYALFGILFCILLITHTSEATAEVFLSSWGSDGTGDGQLQKPWGIAIDSLGYVYVVGSNGVQKFTSDGKFISSWGSSGRDQGSFSDPHGIAIDSLGYVYVVDNNDRVQKFTSDGKFISSWGSSGRDQGSFSDPHGIAIDSLGYVYVVDNNDRVQKFTSDGKFISSWGSSGTSDGQFQKPWGIDTDSVNNVYVADIDNNRIQKFTSDGKFITSWGSEILKFPKNIHISTNDVVYVADTGNHRIQVFTSSGELIKTWGSTGRGQGSFLGPTGIAVNSVDKVFVVDHVNNRIQVFTSLIDTQKPILSVPSGITIDTENEYGVLVPFHVTASDNIEVTGGPRCDYSPEFLFPVGTTLVTCSAQDAAGNIGFASFEVAVNYELPPLIDTQKPILSVPSGITIDTENEYGVLVPFHVTASDNIEVTGGPRCDYSPEFLFPVGTTLVTCSAQDAAGNIGFASFEVAVNYELPPLIDTQKPILSVPSGITIDTENEYGVLVPFHVTASDNIEVTGGPRCDYSPEFLFPVGTTLVTCSAQDAAGNIGFASFEVAVNKMSVGETHVDHTVEYAVAIAGVTSMSGITLAYKAGLLTSKAVGMTNTSTIHSGPHNDGSSAIAQSNHASIDQSYELAEKTETMHEQSSFKEEESQLLHAPSIEIEVSWGFGK